MSRISHSQNLKGFVWGLSTRKILTPCSIQNTTTSRRAFHSAPASSDEKSGLSLCPHLLRGLSAVRIEPSGRRLNHCGCCLQAGSDAIESKGGTIAPHLSRPLHAATNARK